MKRVMVDLETLGKRPGCIVLSIGAVVFDEGGLHDEFYAEINQSSSELHGLRADMSTVHWWNEQSAEARGVLERTLSWKTSADLVYVLTNFANWLVPNIGDVEVWGNGAAFDNIILAECYVAASMNLPWKWSNDRCYRTLKNLFPDIPFARIGTHHNALDDTKSQATHAAAMLRRLNTLPE